MNRTNWLTQFVRYGIVGVVSNAVLYLLFLAFVRFGLAPMLAMSLTYAMGVAQTFVFNKRWTFEHRERAPQAFVRYVLVYLLGYIVNLVLLFVLVGQWHWPHEIVQAAAILGIAVMIFLLQRHWVFAPPQPA